MAGRRPGSSRLRASDGVDVGAAISDTSRPALGRTIVEVIVAGVIAFLAVVVTVGLLDVVRGHTPFHTAALLGTWLFYSSAPPAGVAAWPGPVLAYNGVHLLGSMAIGIAGALLVSEVELNRASWYFALVAGIAALVYTMLLLGALAGEMAGVVSWSTVAVGTAGWFLSMTGWFLRAHRQLVRRLSADVDAEAEP